MWIYEKQLQFPVKIKNPNPRTASIIISQLGGPDGELAASMRYLNQRFSMPDRKIVGILTDVGIEDKNCAYYLRKYDSMTTEILLCPILCEISAQILAS